MSGECSLLDPLQLSAVVSVQPPTRATVAPSLTARASAAPSAAARLEAAAATDGARDHSVSPSAPYVPSDAIRARVAAHLDSAGYDSDLYELRDGSVRLKKLPPVASYCHTFGECGCSGCGCFRLDRPMPRKRFRHLVVSRMETELKGTSSPIRAVTIGSGALLTDFEILLGLWSRGLVVESVVAIDLAYSRKVDNLWRDEYVEALDALAVFFSPCRLTSFGSSNEYVAACSRSPEVYGRANLFLYCDAGAVPYETFKETASAALDDGALAFELANSGGLSHDGQVAHLPPSPSISFHLLSVSSPSPSISFYLLPSPSMARCATLCGGRT